MKLIEQYRGHYFVKGEFRYLNSSSYTGTQNLYYCEICGFIPYKVCHYESIKGHQNKSTCPGKPYKYKGSEAFKFIRYIGEYDPKRDGV
jgi:hypothetical protein